MGTAEIPNIMTELLECEYPFVWQPKNELKTIPENMISRLTDQLAEKVFDDDFQFEYIMLFVGLSYEYGMENRFEEALKTLKKGENKLKELTNPSSAMYKAILHVVLSTKVFLLSKKSDFDIAAEIMSKIPRKEDMNAETQAALHGLHAVLLGEYGISGTKLASEFSSRAIEMNPEESLWYFLKGKYLGRIRRVERPFDIPGTEERDFLNKAIEMKTSPSYLVFTAQLYRETANRIFRTLRINGTLHPKNKLAIDDMNEKSLEFYNKSIELKPHCSHMLFRCAKGLIQLPVPFRDEKRAKKFLDDGLKLAPDSGYGNHVMAQYYERIKKEPEKALKYLRNCDKKNIFGASMDLLRLDFRLNKMIDVVQRLTDMLNVYHEKSRRCQIYSQLVSYHVFKLDVLKKACEYTNKIIHLDPKCEDMLHHRPITVLTYDPIDMYDVLVDEIKIQMQDSKCPDKFYVQFLNDLSWTGKSVPVSKPLYLKNKIISTGGIEPRIQQQSFRKSSKPAYKKNFNVPRRFNFEPRAQFSRHKTDVDQQMSEILSKCRDDLENEKKKTFHRNTASSSGDWRPKQPQKVPEREPAKGSTARKEDTRTIEAEKSKIELTREIENTRNEEDDSEDSDDVAFRMKIYERTKESLRVCSELSKMNATQPNDIVESIQKMKIQDESLKKDSTGHNSSDVHMRTPEPNSKMNNVKENRSGRHYKSNYSYRGQQTNSKEDGELQHDSNFPRRENKSCDHRESQPNHKEELRAKDDRYWGPSKQSEDRSGDREEHKSKCTHRKRSFDTEVDEVLSSVSKCSEGRSRDCREKYSHRKEHSPKDIEFKRRSNVSKHDGRSHSYRKHESKHSHQQRSSSEDDEFERRSGISKHSGMRSHDHRSKHSRQRSSEEDDQFKQRSQISRHSGSRSHDHRSKHSQQRSSSEEGDEFKQGSRNSRHGGSQSHAHRLKHSRQRSSSEEGEHDGRSHSHRKHGSKHSHKRRSSSSKEDDEFEQRSHNSRHKGSRSHDHRSKHSRQRSSSEDDEFERRSHNSRHGGSRSYDHRSKHSRQRPSREENDEFERRSNVSRHDGRSHSHRKHESKHSHRQGLSSNEDDQFERRSNASRHNEGRSHDRRKHRSKHSHRSSSYNEEDDEFERRSNASKHVDGRSHNHKKYGSKHSHCQKPSCSEDDSDDRSLKQSKNRSHDHREKSKKSQRRHLSNDDNDEELECRSNFSKHNEGRSRNHRQKQSHRRSHSPKDNPSENLNKKTNDDFLRPKNSDHLKEVEDPMAAALKKLSKKFEPKTICF